MNPKQLFPTRIASLFFAGGMTVAAMAHAAPPPVPQVVISGGEIEPESITSTKNGTLFIGSMKARIIYRAQPGAAVADAWIQPPEGLLSYYGISADEPSNTLWACSGDYYKSLTPEPPTSAIYAFDLKTGALKERYPLSTRGTVCNDVAVGPDGTAYVTEMNKMEVWRLKKGAHALELWAGNGGFGPTGGLLDGIAVVGNRVIVGAIRAHKLFSVPIESGGKAGAITEVKLDGAFQSPDGIRPFGKDGLLIMAGGKLSHVVLNGNTGKVTVLKEGFQNGAPCVTVVGTTAYVLTGMQAKAPQVKAIAVEVGKP